MERDGHSSMNGVALTVHGMIYLKRGKAFGLEGMKDLEEGLRLDKELNVTIQQV